MDNHKYVTSETGFRFAEQNCTHCPLTARRKHLNKSDIKVNRVAEESMRLTLLFGSYPETEYVYMMCLPPSFVLGEHSEVSGSCSLPQLCPEK